MPDRSLAHAEKSDKAAIRQATCLVGMGKADRLDIPGETRQELELLDLGVVYALRDVGY